MSIVGGRLLVGSGCVFFFPSTTPSYYLYESCVAAKLLGEVSKLVEKGVGHGEDVDYF